MARKANGVPGTQDNLQTLLEETEVYLIRKKAVNNSNFQDGKLIFSSTKSCIWFNGEPIPPPLLSEEEKKQMEEYRNAALRCEQAMQHRRQKKYAEQMSQLKAVMNRIQRKESQPNQVTSSRDVNANDVSRATSALFHKGQNWQTKFESRSQTRPADESSGSRTITTLTRRTALTPETRAEVCSNNDLSLTHRQGNDRNTQRLAHQTRQTEDSITNPQESIVPRSTHTAPAVEPNNWMRHFPQVPPEQNVQGVSMSVAESLRSQSSVSTVLEQSRTEIDSLASTSLSLAMTDASIISEPETFRTAQRQLHLASMSESPYNAYQQHLTGSSTPKDLSHQRAKQGLDKHLHKGVKFHDLSLDSLETTRQKLLEQKEKELARLKQLELKRISSLSDVSDRVPAVRPEGKLMSGNPQGILNRSNPYQEQPTATAPFGRNSAVGQDDSCHGSFESEIQMSDSIKRYSSSPKEPLTPNMEGGRHLDLSSGRRQAWAPQHQYSHTDSNSTGGIVRSFSVTGAGGPSPGSYSFAAMAQDGGDFSSNAEPDSASDKENQQAGSFHSGYHPKKLDARSKMLPGRDILSKTGEQDSGYDRKFALLSAVAKGFVTRRLLKADKIQAMVKTVRESQALLSSFSAEQSHSVQDKEFKGRVESQLRAARNSISDVFHKIPVHERMAYIAHSRNAAREKEARQHKIAADSRSKPLSAATMRAMQRRRESHISEGVTQRKPLPSAHPKKPWNIRVLKPMQGNASPARPDTIRSKRQAKRPETAPEKSSTEKRTDKNDRRPTTAAATRQPAGRVVLGGNVAATGKRVAPQATKRTGKHVANPPTRPEHVGDSRRPVERSRPAAQLKKNSRPVAAKFDCFK